MKIMILTDSDGNPRSFPASEVFSLEETYPYILRNHFRDATFWQLSYGNITTMKLLSQPMGYLTHWNPDIIVVQSGIADCRPEAFSDLQKEILKKFTWKFFGWIMKYIEHPQWIKYRQLYRVTPGSFRTTLKKFRMMYPKAKIFWFQISTGPKYELSRPGLERRKAEFNAIIKDIYGNDFIACEQKMLEADGFNAKDHGHPNKRGHRVMADLLLERIYAYLKETKDVSHAQP